MKKTLILLVSLISAGCTILTHTPTPSTALEFYDLAVIAWSNDDLDDAMAYLSSAVELDSECWDCYFLRADLKRYLYDLDGAIEDLLIVGTNAPDRELRKRAHETISDIQMNDSKDS